MARRQHRIKLEAAHEAVDLFCGRAVQSCDIGEGLPQ
jgi:hypothetical protein